MSKLTGLEWKSIDGLGNVLTLEVCLECSNKTEERGDLYISDSIFGEFICNDCKNEIKPLEDQQ